MIPFVDLKAQHDSLRSEIDRSLADVLDAGSFILGNQVEAFEHEFARYVGAEHAIGVGTGLDALRLALVALDVGQGDEVIVPANSFIASALAVSATGAKPVFVEPDAETYNIDPEALEGALTERTRAVMPVHLCGRPADMDRVMKVAERHGVPVVEDAAQAHGARIGDASCGAIGTVGCFSFYPSKNLGGLGDGGMVVTNDGDIANRVRRLRNIGESQKYVHVEIGTNSRLDSIHAAVLSAKLKRLDAWNQLRRAHAESYRTRLTGVGDITFPRDPEDGSAIYHLFVIETDERDGLMEELRGKDVGVGVHYPVPIHLQEAYRHLGHKPGDFPVAERLAHRSLSLPMYPELTEDQIDEVCGYISSFYA